MAAPTQANNRLVVHLGSSLLAAAEAKERKREMNCKGVSTGCASLDNAALNGEGFRYGEIISLATGPGTDAGGDLVS